MKRRFIIALVHVDASAHGTIGDIIEGVGKNGRIVQHGWQAKRYKSLKRALNAAEGWTWYADLVRVMEVER